MNLRTGIVILLSGALFIAGRAGAQPREVSLPDAEAAAITPHLAVWMQRLVGRFRFDGSIHHEEYIEPLDYDRRGKLQKEMLRFDNDGNPDPDPDGPSTMVLRPKVSDWSRSTTGKGDCIDFGGGPGLQCVINVAWDEVWRGSTLKAELGGVSDLNPAMILAGLAPVTGGVRFLEVDDRGLAHPGRLALKGNSAILKPPCVNTPGVWDCEIIISIEARHDADILFAQVTNRLYFERAEGGSRENVEQILMLSLAMHREARATEDGEQAAEPTPEP